MSKLYDVEDYIDVFDNIVSSRTSGDQVIKILMKIKEKLDKSEKEDTEPDSYLEFCRLINKIKKYPCSPAIFILKMNLETSIFMLIKMELWPALIV